MVIPYIDDWAKDLTVAMGLPAEAYGITKYLCCMLAVFPLSAVIQCFKNRYKAKMFYVLIYSTLILYILVDWIFTLICIFECAVVYLWLKKYPNKPIYVWIFSFLLLFVAKVWDMTQNWLTWGSPGPGALMFLVCKFSFIAQTLADGNKTKEESSKLSKRQKKYAIKEVPSVLEYLSYLAFFVGAIPLVEYYDYKNYIYQKEQYKKVPSSLKAVCQMLPWFLGWLLIQLVLQPHFKFDRMLDDDWTAEPWWWKTLYFWIGSYTWRSKYMCSFFLGDIAVRVAGLSYNGQDDKGNHKWDRMQGTDPRIEYTWSAIIITKYWNKSTAEWLRYYVFERIHLGKKSRVLGAALFTFTFSCLWHGLYPGYFITFFWWFGLIVFAKVQFRALRHCSKNSRWIFTAFLYWFNRFVGLVFLPAFHFLSFDRIWTAFSNLGWWMHISYWAVFVFMVVTQFKQKPPKDYYEKKKKAIKNKEEEQKKKAIKNKEEEKKKNAVMDQEEQVEKCSTSNNDCKLQIISPQQINREQQAKINFNITEKVDFGNQEGSCSTYNTNTIEVNGKKEDNVQNDE